MGTACQNQPEVHDLTAGAAHRGPDGLPGGALQGRGDRRAGRPAGVPRGGSARRQGQRPRLPQRSDGADLVDAGLGGRAADVTGPPAAAAATEHDELDHLRALPRRHRLGDRRRGRLGGGARPVRPSAVPVGVVLRLVPRLVGPRPGLPAEQPDRRPPHLGLAGVAGRARGRRPRRDRAHPAGARDHPRLRRRAGALDGRRARPPQRPGLGRRPRARRPTTGGCTGHGCRGRRSPTSTGSTRGCATSSTYAARCPTCTPPRRPRSGTPATRACCWWSASTRSGPLLGAYNVTGDEREVVGRRAALARAAHPRAARRDQRPARPSSTTARSGWRRTPPPGSTTATVPDDAAGRRRPTLRSASAPAVDPGPPAGA